jgi:hypothetical protein
MGSPEGGSTRTLMTRAGIEPAAYGLRVRLSNRPLTEGSAKTSSSRPGDRNKGMKPPKDEPTLVGFLVGLISSFSTHVMDAGVARYVRKRLWLREDLGCA